VVVFLLSQGVPEPFPPTLFFGKKTAGVFVVPRQDLYQPIPRCVILILGHLGRLLLLHLQGVPRTETGLLHARTQRGTLKPHAQRRALESSQSQVVLLVENAGLLERRRQPSLSSFFSCVTLYFSRREEREGLSVSVSNLCFLRLKR